MRMADRDGKGEEGRRMQMEGREWEKLTEYEIKKSTERGKKGAEKRIRGNK